jgi:hypothetical protein
MQPAAQPVTPTKPDEPKQTLHPTITEVLYAVPKEGDPDQDGKRSATGDEFVELVNPHDKPISLKGYSLRDAKKGPPDKSGKSADKPVENSFRFTFPDLTLQPGEVVVVFNGYESSPAGPVGTKDKAAAKNPKFHDAYVFSVKPTSQYVALSNNGDSITLSDPEGKALECVYWGDKQQPEAALVTKKAPESRGSVQRTDLKGDFVRHQELAGSAGDVTFSPGQFDLKSTHASAPEVKKPGKK